MLPHLTAYTSIEQEIHKIAILNLKMMEIILITYNLHLKFVEKYMLYHYSTSHECSHP